MIKLLLLITICISSISFGQNNTATVTYEKLLRTLQCTNCGHKYSFEIYNLISVAPNYEKYAQKLVSDANNGEFLRILNKTTSKTANRPLEYCNNRNYRECNYEVSNEKVSKEREAVDFTEYIDAENLREKQTKELTKLSSAIILKMAEKAAQMTELRDTVNLLYHSKDYFNAYKKHSLIQDLSREIISCLSETKGWYNKYDEAKDADNAVRAAYRKIESDYFKSDNRDRGDSLIYSIIKHFEQNISIETIDTLDNLLEFVNGKINQSTYGLRSSIDFKGHSEKLEGCKSFIYPKYLKSIPLTDFEKKLIGEYKMKSKPFKVGNGGNKVVIKSHVIIKNNREITIIDKLVLSGAVMNNIADAYRGGSNSKPQSVENNFYYRAYQKENNLVHFDIYYIDGNKLIEDTYELKDDGQNRVSREYISTDGINKILTGKKIK